MSSTAPRRRSEPAPPAIALTPGEPAGIGPDLALALARLPQPGPLVCFADPAMLAARARLLGLDIALREVADPGAAVAVPAGVLQVVPVATAAPCTPGRLDTRNAPYVLNCLDQAMDACRSGVLAALVTGPVQKSLINDAGIPFSGHTEYLAERLGAPLPVMMLVAERLRVALVTTHVPLRAVADLVTAPLLDTVLDILHHDLVAHFGLTAPRIAVCGLNPHAGEGGHLGREDGEVIAPVVAAARGRGWSVDGPLPADTAFTAPNRARYDAFLAMYHDQGLTVLKSIGFGHAINVTLGLPIVRTSVDHGTALDLAGSGRADGGSLAAAVALARELAAARRARHAA